MMQGTSEQLPKAVVLQNALAVLAKPIGRDVAEMKVAAAIVNEAREEAVAEHGRIKAECDSRVLDMLSAGNNVGARSLAQRELAARELVKQLESAIHEANRRQLEAKLAAEDAEAREKIDLADPIMKDRLEIAVELEASARKTGELMARASARGFDILNHLPTTDSWTVDFLDRGDIERRVVNTVLMAAGVAFEGPTSIASACRAGHAALINKHMPRGVGTRKVSAVIGGQEVTVEFPDVRQRLR